MVVPSRGVHSVRAGLYRMRTEWLRTRVKRWATRHSHTDNDSHVDDVGGLPGYIIGFWFKTLKIPFLALMTDTDDAGQRYVEWTCPK